MSKREWYHARDAPSPRTKSSSLARFRRNPTTKVSVPGRSLRLSAVGAFWLFEDSFWAKGLKERVQQEFRVLIHWTFLLGDVVSFTHSKIMFSDEAKRERERERARARASVWARRDGVLVAGCDFLKGATDASRICFDFWIPISRGG